MKLEELLRGVAVKSSTAANDLDIQEVRYDSRAVQPGDLFVAIRGFATDGHQYIGKALAQGAAAIVCEEAPEGVPAVVVENARKALAEIAANRFGHPADSMVMLGVTGTNGKTTGGPQGRPDRYQPEPDWRRGDRDRAHHPGEL